MIDNFGSLDAKSVHQALQKQDIVQLVMTLGTRTSPQIEQLKKAFHALYNQNLSDSLAEAFRSDKLLRFLDKLIQGKRSISGQTIQKSRALDEFQVLTRFPVTEWDRLDVMNQILPILTDRDFEFFVFWKIRLKFFKKIGHKSKI